MTNFRVIFIACLWLCSLGYPASGAGNAPNSPPSFLSGPDVEVNEDGGFQSFPNWAAQITPGPSAESGQIVRFEVLNKDNTLFAMQPANNPDGTLTFQPAHGAFGTTLVTIFAQDDGGTENGGEDTSEEQTFTITLLPVNDPPVFEMRADPVVNEDSGETFLPGWAYHIGPGSQFEVGQTFQFLVSSDNGGLFSAPPTISPDGTLSFTTTNGVSGSARVTVVLRDDGGTERGGQDSAAPVTFTITVVPVNEPPVGIIQASPVLTFTGNTTNAVVISADNREAAVFLDGSASFDADGDAISLFWFVDDAAVPFASGATASITLDPGHHIISLVADDGRASGTSELAVEIITPAMAVEEILDLLQETKLNRRETRSLSASLRAASLAFEHGYIRKGVIHLAVFHGKVRVIVWPRDRVTAKRLQNAAREIIEALRSK